MTINFENVNDEILRYDWYELPSDIQKMLPIILNGTQCPAVVIGFGNIECSRGNFKKVRHICYDCMNFSNCSVTGNHFGIFLFQRVSES